MYLTVAFPVFNVKEYLEEAVASVLMQTFKDYEILLVDDGSTDGSAEICDNLRMKYPDIIKVIHKENSGSLFTRRVCLQEARGEFIHVMDADDKLIDKDAYNKIKKLLDKTEADMLFFLSTKNEMTMEINHPVNFENGQVFEDENKIELCKLFLNSTTMNALWNKVFRRSVVDLDEDYSNYTNVINGTDVFQMLPIFTNAKRIVYLKEIFYFYRTTEGSIGRHFNPKMYDSIKENSLRLEDYLKKWNLNEDKQFVDMLMTKRLSGCTTAANRVHFCDESEKIQAIEYLRTIATDKYFLNVYKYRKYLDFRRQIIAEMLRLHFFNMIWVSTRIYKK